jgi:hypothetical protein
VGARRAVLPPGPRGGSATGPALAFHAHPNLTLEGGGGLSLEGWKLGARGRYNFLQAPLTPFVGAGVMRTFGLSPVDVTNSEDPMTVISVVRILPSTFIQAVVGLDWIDVNSFNLVTSVGYAWLLGGSNVEVLTGELGPIERQSMDIAFGSSIVISLAMGYSFR